MIKVLKKTMLFILLMNVNAVFTEGEIGVASAVNKNTTDLTLAEEMLRLKPDHINYCPYKITFTELNKNISIGTRLLPTNTQSYEINKFSVKINEILREIVDYTSSEDLFILDKLQ